MTSEEVQEAMKELKMRREGVQKEVGPPGYWLVDEDALREIQPTLAFVQNSCEICDPSRDDVLFALDNLKKSENGHGKIEIVQVAPTTLEGLFDCIKVIANALGSSKQGDELALNLRSRLQMIEEQVETSKEPRPRVLSLEGLAPLCTGGHWLPDMKHAAGCIDALGDKSGCAARIITWEEISTADPDILVISPCSASPTRTLNDMHLVASSSEFWKLRCVQKGDVYIMDHGCFSRPGPRLVEGIEMMRAAFFCDILPLESDHFRLSAKWMKDVLKHQGWTGDGLGVSPCNGMELASQFRPCCFRSKKIPSPRTRLIPPIQCKVPNKELPTNRSAHCIVPIYRKQKISLLLFGGEGQDGKRLWDTWELHAPSDGWPTMTSLDSESMSTTELRTAHTWKRLMCGKVSGENVPTPRSNHAMVTCGEHILVFGGWSIDNRTPLSHCELLHTNTLCWTHCSTRGIVEPGPRGNPTLVYSMGCNMAILFGGWNGKHALDDLWILDMTIWQWKNISKQQTDCAEWPSPRTDHTAVLWNKTKQKEVMLVFGGSIEGLGPCSELWALKFSKDTSIAWQPIPMHGAAPPARTSHSASIVGEGNHAKMIIVGGTSLERGTGPASMLCDAWVLHLTQDANKAHVWKQLDWSGTGLNRCRHSMTAINENTLVWWGGFDGTTAVDDGIGIWQGCLGEAVATNPTPVLSTDGDDEEQPSIMQERWAAEVPIREDDLPPELVTKAKQSRLPGALYKAIHRHAVSKNRDTYIDPVSGYSVFSSVYLKRRPCCGNGCRHCPHGHINVPGRNKHGTLCDDKDLKW